MSFQELFFFVGDVCFSHPLSIANVGFCFSGAIESKITLRILTCKLSSH